MSSDESITESVARLKKQIEASEAVTVSIALFGRTGAGKSSLINRLMGKNLARVGASTDTTVDASTFQWNGVHLVDLPGFDTARFPKETFWERFNLDSFDIFLCVFSDKFGSAESDFFLKLRQKKRTCLFVRNKADQVCDTSGERSTNELYGEIEKDVARQVLEPTRVHFTSCATGAGLAELSDAISKALPKAKQERWIESAKAYSREFLAAKEELCKKKVRLYAGLCAANAINPVPGVDVAVDLSILVAMMKAIRNAYGLSDQSILKAKELGIPAIAQLANNVVRYGTREGAVYLLQRFMGREITKEVAKYIPLVGQIVAASAGFGITLQAGGTYLADCHGIAGEILSRELAFRA
ncbi:MAG: 50S ribosome-binding GTPase [Deltaproteobacteria bacterium]|nr:50S ribosome-binding GTPase [Deltaproteobacteria bacterium]